MSTIHTERFAGSRDNPLMATVEGSAAATRDEAVQVALDRMDRHSRGRRTSASERLVVSKVTSDRIRERVQQWHVYFVRRAREPSGN